MIRMYGFHSELSVGEGTGLIKDHGLHLGQDIHVVGALDEDTFARGTADTTEEGEGNTDNQRTGTGHHQEHQGTVEPGRELRIEN